jgi:hypothetical protein
LDAIVRNPSRICPILLGALFHLGGLAASPVAANYLPPDDIHSELLRRYLGSLGAQEAPGRCVEVEVTIRARLPKLDRQAVLRALRTTSPAGRISYQALDTSGDSMVRREVIARYLTAEDQGPEVDGIAISPSNYRFRFVRAVEQAGRQAYIYQLSPRQKRVGLFKGELWLDSQTGLRIHESGQFVSTPSIFVKRITFVREYQIRDGIAIPERAAITVETRLVGRAELSIQFSNYECRQPQDPAGETDRKCL